MKYKIQQYLKYWWTLWTKSLGIKRESSNSDRYVDKVAFIRTCIVLLYIITNIFIIAGVIRHW